MQGEIKLARILFIGLSIGMDVLLATLSYFTYTTKTGFGWILASVLCGIESIIITVFIVVIVVQYFCYKKPLPTLLLGESEEDLRASHLNISESNVSAQQESEGDYIEFFNFMIADQSNRNSEHCRVREKNTSRSSYSQMLQSDDSGIVLLRNENTKCANIAPHRMHQQVYATFVKDPKVHQSSLISACRMKSLENAEVALPLQFSTKKNTIYPKHLDIPNYLCSCQRECDEPENTVRSSISPKKNTIYPKQLDIPDYLCICQREYDGQEITMSSISSKKDTIYPKHLNIPDYLCICHREYDGQENTMSSISPKKDAIHPKHLNIPDYLCIHEREYDGQENTIRSSISSKKGAIYPKHLDIPNYLRICQHEYDEQVNTEMSSTSPIVVHDNASTLGDISSTRSESSHLIDDEDGDS